MSDTYARQQARIEKAILDAREVSRTSGWSWTPEDEARLRRGEVQIGRTSYTFRILPRPVEPKPDERSGL